MIKHCSILGCVTSRGNHLRNGMCDKHYMRGWSGKAISDWRDIFIAQNPPTEKLGKIPVSPDGKFTLVDRDIYDRCIKFNWHYDPDDGVKRTMGKVDGHDYKIDHKFMYLHREITGCVAGLVVDHINHNNLDNRKENLRICSIHQNLMNKIKYKGLSQFKGVSRKTGRNKWSSFIGYHGKSIYLGSWNDEQAAADVYDAASMILFGKFANPNRIPTFDTLVQAHISAGRTNEEALKLAVEARDLIIKQAIFIVEASND